MGVLSEGLSDQPISKFSYRISLPSPTSNLRARLSVEGSHSCNYAVCLTSTDYSSDRHLGYQ